MPSQRPTSFWVTRWKRLRASFALFNGADHCIGVGSGTDALHLTLRGLGLGPGDEVITAANSFIASALAITYTGATPVLVDVDPVRLPPECRIAGARHHTAHQGHSAGSLVWSTGQSA